MVTTGWSKKPADAERSLEPRAASDHPVRHLYSLQRISSAEGARAIESQISNRADWKRVLQGMQINGRPANVAPALLPLLDLLVDQGVGCPNKIGSFTYHARVINEQKGVFSPWALRSLRRLTSNNTRELHRMRSNSHFVRRTTGKMYPDNHLFAH